MARVYPINHLLEGIGLKKIFGGLIALQDINFFVDKGEIFGLIGPNGAGKTTLFNLIAGVYKPDLGEIHFEGDDIAGLRPDKICQIGIARTFQIPKPFLNLSVLENVTVGAYFGHYKKRGLKEAKARAEEAIERAKLKEKIRTQANNLTLLERKHLELARALATQPIILLLDEVIAGLNPTEALRMADTILEIRTSGITIFMIEHVIKAVMKVSDRILVLHYGKKIAEGRPGEIVNNSEVVKAYLGGMTYA
jgi:branched-chain amino acid transport system ATP-binding protein